MASKQLVRKLPEDVTCPICMEILQEPVTIDCGHNFCLRCITKFGEASEDFILCPLCKAFVSRRTFQPNKRLESLTENIQDMEKEESELRCQRHNEKLLYFCEEDMEFICSVCCDSKDHTFHNVNQIEEAAQNYQEQIQAQPQVLGQKDKEVLEEKKQGKGKLDAFKAKVHLKRLNIQEKFKHLRKILKEEERVLLARQKNLEEEEHVLLARQKNLEEEERLLLDSLLWMEQERDKLEEQLSSFRQLTISPRDKQQMPLLQDMGITLSRNQGFQFTNPTPVLVDMEDRFNEAASRHESTIESMKKLTDEIKIKDPKKKDESLSWHSLKAEKMESWPLLSGENKGSSLTEENIGDLNTSVRTPTWYSRLSIVRKRKQRLHMGPAGSSLTEENIGDLNTSVRTPTWYSHLSIVRKRKQRLHMGPAEDRKIKNEKKKEKRLSWYTWITENMESWPCLSGESKDVLTTSGPVTLNPMSADPELTLSRDLKTVSLQPLRGRAGNKQAKPRHFDHYHWVLGSQGLSSGHLIWKVKLQGTDKGACVVGVATELAPGQHCLKHIWALQISDSECQPITENDAHENFPIFLKNVGIYLDRDHGKVTFFNPATDEQIYTFQESFTGQVFPVFGLLNSGSQITLIP